MAKLEEMVRLINLIYVLNVPPLTILVFCIIYIGYKCGKSLIHMRITKARKKELDSSITAYMKDHGVSFQEAVDATLSIYELADNHNHM